VGKRVMGVSTANETRLDDPKCIESEIGGRA